MPEGDSIRRAAARISQALLGQELVEVRCPSERTREFDWPGRLTGRTLQSAEPHGKNLQLFFDGDVALYSHLKMTGRWHVYPRGRRWRYGAWRAWLVMATAALEVVQFNGPVLELMTHARARRDPRIHRLGPDVLDDDFDPAVGAAELRRLDPRERIGDALLRQGSVAGLGNLFKNEACFAAKVSPWRPVGDLSEVELVRVVTAGSTLMGRGVRASGRAPRTIYGRAGMPCPVCRTRIRSRGQGDDNRTTYWCPRCQPGPEPPRVPGERARTG